MYDDQILGQALDVQLTVLLLVEAFLLFTD
jgi:hypothetical protein